MTPRARITHTLPGRLRLKVPEMRGQADFFERVRALLERQAEVESVLVNPLTGSVLITAPDAADLQDVVARGERTGLYSLSTGPVTVTSPARRAKADLRRLDAIWTRTSGGSTDTRSTIIAFLVIAGLVQIARGRILGPAWGLLVTAYQLLDAQPETDEE